MPGTEKSGKRTESYYIVGKEFDSTGLKITSEEIAKIAELKKAELEASRNKDPDELAKEKTVDPGKNFGGLI